MISAINSKIKYPLFYSLYLITIWTFYRLSGISVIQEIDEFLIKPIIWLLPIFLLIRKEKSWWQSLGITTKNLLAGIYLAAFLGLIFGLEAVFIGYFKRGNFDFIQSLRETPILYSLLISVGTAVSSEVAFRGYIFSRFWNSFKNEIWANVTTSFLWLVIHIPASVALLGYGMFEMISYLFLVFVYSLGACFVFARTKNVFSTIFLYILWEASIILFR